MKRGHDDQRLLSLLTITFAVCLTVEIAHQALAAETYEHALQHELVASKLPAMEAGMDVDRLPNNMQVAFR